MTRSRGASGLLAGMGLILLALGYLLVRQPLPTHAQDTADEPTGDNSFCLTCHSDMDKDKVLADGTHLNLTVQSDTLADSVHADLGCVDCHGTDIFPHDDPLPASGRTFTILQSLNCTKCHTDETENLADGVHYTALINGNLNAASCVDCHGAHDITPPDEPRSKISETCGHCHTTVFSEYRDSVHGAALFEGDPNVPTCIDCHGVHGIQHPTTALFRNRSPELCASCHANELIMSQYGITTNVFNSYLSDFHGTTVALFEQTDPNVPSSKAVCFDCHGVHNIAEVNAANSQVVQQNLLSTCQKCHPGASTDFPEAWIGHFPPAPDNHPLMFVVNLFYNILIPVVLGGFVFLILTDIVRRLRDRVRRGGKA